MRISKTCNKNIVVNLYIEKLNFFPGQNACNEDSEYESYRMKILYVYLSIFLSVGLTIHQSRYHLSITYIHTKYT